MKIVINKCYGGFGLSGFGISEYLKLNGEEAFFYKKNYRNKLYEKVGIDEYGMECICFKKDYGESFSISDVEYDFFFYTRDIDRTDKNLISIIEKYGDKINGWAANLKIVEIPDDVKYEIEEYDGIEWIAESHRKWE